MMTVAPVEGRAVARKIISFEVSWQKILQGAFLSAEQLGFFVGFRQVSGEGKAVLGGELSELLEKRWRSGVGSVGGEGEVPSAGGMACEPCGDAIEPFRRVGRRVKIHELQGPPDAGCGGGETRQRRDIGSDGKD